MHKKRLSDKILPRNNSLPVGASTIPYPRPVPPARIQTVRAVVAANKKFIFSEDNWIALPSLQNRTPRVRHIGIHIINIPEQTDMKNPYRSIAKNRRLRPNVPLGPCILNTASQVINQFRLPVFEHQLMVCQKKPKLLPLKRIFRFRRSLRQNSSLFPCPYLHNFHSAVPMEPALVASAVFAQLTAQPAVRTHLRAAANHQITANRHIGNKIRRIIRIHRPKIISNLGIILNPMHGSLFFLQRKKRPFSSPQIPSACPCIFKRLPPWMPVKPRLFRMNGLIVILVNRHPQFLLHSRGLSHNSVIYINIPVNNFDFLPRFSNQPFDIINFRLQRILKHHHIPPVRLKKLIHTLQNKNLIALIHPLVVERVLFPHPHPISIPATRTAALLPNRQILIWKHIFLHLVLTGGKIVVIPITALLTAQTKMSTLQRIRHAAGWNPVNLHKKDNKNQRRSQRCNQPFQEMIDSFSPTL